MRVFMKETLKIIPLENSVNTFHHLSIIVSS